MNRKLLFGYIFMVLGCIASGFALFSYFYMNHLVQSASMTGYYHFFTLLDYLTLPFFELKLLQEKIALSQIYNSHLYHNLQKTLTYSIVFGLLFIILALLLLGILEYISNKFKEVKP